jgi:hypothetical protein
MQYSDLKCFELCQGEVVIICVRAKIVKHEDKSMSHKSNKIAFKIMIDQWSSHEANIDDNFWPCSKNEYAKTKCFVTAILYIQKWSQI